MYLKRHCFSVVPTNNNGTRRLLLAPYQSSLLLLGDLHTPRCDITSYIMENRILRNLCNRVQLGFIALRLMTQKRKSGGRGTALRPIGLDSEYYPRCYLKPPLETGMGPLFINPGSKLLEIAALGVGNARTLRRQWNAYAPAEGHASHEKFSPVFFSFFLVLSSPKYSFLLFTFLFTFLSTYLMKETMSSFTA